MIISLVHCHRNSCHRNSDGDGKFAVWSSQLARAMESEARYGPGSFGLRGYALDLNTLPGAGSSDDSTYRVEVVEASQRKSANADAQRPPANDAWRAAAFCFDERLAA